MEKLKALFTGKYAKFFIPATVIVVGVGVYQMNRKKPTPQLVGYGEYPAGYQVSDDPGAAGSVTDSEVQGMIQELAADVYEMQQENNQNIVEAFNEALHSYEDTFQQTFSGLYGDFESYKKETESLLRSSSRIGKNTYDLFEPDPQYEPIAARPTTDRTRVFGYGGISYDTANEEERRRIEQNEERIKSDRGYRKSEIKRAETVIENRRKAGEDTADQEKYLKRLLEMG